METVNVQCGECQQIIGVSREDLGHHVQCPLCNKIVLAPAEDSEPESTDETDPAPESEPAPEVKPIPHIPEIAPQAEPESIFSDPEDVSDDLFGASPTPQVVLPSEEQEEEAPADEPAHEEKPVREEVQHESAPVDQTPDEAESYDNTDDRAQDYGDQWQDHSSPVTTAEHEFQVPRERRSQPPGMMAPLVLIFLVPYSIILTCVLIWLFTSGRLTGANNQQNNDDSSNGKGGLEYLLDDEPQGKPKKIDPNAKLSKNLHIAVGERIRLGQVQVRPNLVTILKERQTTLDRLYLYLRIKNVSDNVRMNPIPRSFIKPGNKQKMYTYLQVLNRGRSGGPSTSKGLSIKCYVDDLEWWTMPDKNGKQKMMSTGILNPGEEMLAILRIRLERQEMEQLKKMKQPLLWRVKVRRGLQTYKSREYALAAVIGVEFNLSELKPEDQSRFVLN